MGLYWLKRLFEKYGFDYIGSDKFRKVLDSNSICVERMYDPQRSYTKCRVSVLYNDSRHEVIKSGISDIKDLESCIILVIRKLRLESI